MSIPLRPAIRFNPGSKSTNQLIFFPFYLLFGSYTIACIRSEFSHSKPSNNGLFYQNFQGFTYCSIFCFQSAFCLLLSQQQLLQDIMAVCFCQPFFPFSSKLFHRSSMCFQKKICRRFQRRVISYQRYRQKSTIFLNYFIFLEKLDFQNIQDN